MTVATPRTTTEALRHTDTLLAHITPRWTATIHALTDTLPGHSGTPAGNGNPPGGHGATTTTIVERATETGTAARQRLTRAQALPKLCLTTLDELAGELGIRALTMPTTQTPGMQWAWTAYVTRLCAAHAEQNHHTPPQQQTSQLYRLVAEAANLVDTWTRPAHPPTEPRTLDLANDLTDLWCRSCLRVGRRSPRHDAYNGLGLCNWCGRFHGSQGFLPTLRLLDHHHDGRRITDALITAERPDQPKAKRRRRRK